MLEPLSKTLLASHKVLLLLHGTLGAAARTPRPWLPRPRSLGQGSSGLGGLGQQLSGGQQLAASVRQYPLPASTSHCPSLRFLIAPSRPCHFAMYFVSYPCHCNKAIVARGALHGEWDGAGELWFGQWDTHRERVGVLGVPL